MIGAVSLRIYQIQNVLRTYGRQLSRRQPRSETEREPDVSRTDTRPTAEAKRREVVGRVTREMVSRMAHQPRPQQDDVLSWWPENGALRRLSEEYGRSLRLTLEGGIEVFKVVDEEAGTVEALSDEESARLHARLTELTREIVEETMLKAS